MSENNHTAEEERALEAMLDEALGGARPPDLSGEILARFYGSDADLEKKVSRARSRKSGRSNHSRSKSIAVAFATIVGLAAMLAGLFLYQPDHDISDSVAELVDNAGNAEDQDEGSNSTTASGSDEQPPKAAKKNAKRKSRKGVPMTLQPPRLDQAEVAVSPSESLDVTVPDEAEAAELALVSSQVDSEMEGYWDAVGIEPTDEATAEETAARLEKILGIEISAEAVADVDRLRAEVGQSLNAQAIASKWLNQITNRRSRRMDAKLRDQLVSEIARCIQTGSSFDKKVAEWLSGKSGNSDAFFSALAAGPRSVGGEHGMARSLAALTLNVDVRCTRCHDSYIEGNGQQSDYWNFISFLNRGVQKDADGNYTVDTGKNESDPVFYELSDGRQRVADPRLPSAWMKGSSSNGHERMQSFSKALVGSSELASGVVNSLWQLVHGQPLRGRVVDPISAPHNEALQRLEEQLTQDLLESRFDVARTLALIIASPATRRGVPKTLLPENMLVANQSDIDAAMNAVDAFAAVLPPRVSLPVAQRTDRVLRSIGARIDSTGRDSLAQISEGGKPAKVKKEKVVAADFPEKVKLLPVQWLKLIEDRDSQIDHLGYLSGQNEVPDYVQELVESMQDAEVGPNVLLNRVWWLMKP
jgi:hypothetical protein